MKKGIDCEVFQDQLDALSGEALSEEGIDLLRRHAATCSECATLLRMREHLAETSPGNLEAAVPGALVDSVWRRVQAEIAVKESRRPSRASGWRQAGWLLPALAAASVVLLIGTGFLLGELRRLRDREALLVQEIVDHERRLSRLDRPADSPLLLRRGTLSAARAWQRTLERRETVSIEDLTEMLASLPSRTTLFGQSDVEALISSLPLWIGSAWREALEEVSAEDGIQASELLELILRLDIDSSRRIPSARILSFSRGALRAG